MFMQEKEKLKIQIYDYGIESTFMCQPTQIRHLETQNIFKQISVHNNNETVLRNTDCFPHSPCKENMEKWTVHLQM